MAEEFQDPRDVAWHPRRATELMGHAAAEARLLQAHQSGKLHHAWVRERGLPGALDHHDHP